MMKKLLRKRCKMCNKQFKKKYSNHKFCCKKCSNEYNKYKYSYVGEGGTKFKKARVEDFERQSNEEKFNSMMIFVKDYLDGKIKN